MSKIKMELRHDRHTVSLLSDHMAFAPRYRGKILTGDIAMITEGIICKTCKELDIEIIEIAVNPDHVHIFFKYPPKYPLSFIAKECEEGQAEYSGKNFLIFRIGVANICGRQAVFTGLLGMDGMLSVNTLKHRIHIMQKALCTGLVLKYGVCDCVP
jgi:putative transposase